MASAEAGMPRVVARDSEEARKRRAMRIGVIRILILTNVLLGVYYLLWRYTASINWTFWWVSIPLLAAETYSFIDGMLFGTTMWRLRDRPAPAPPRGDETVDVFITCYNEPVDLVRETVRAAKAIRHPHLTWVLDDGRSPDMQAMAEEEGVGYIVRSADWEGHDRHAKAGNINNALFMTQGEFLLILDADQKPKPEILDRVLGYFRDPRVSLVQTPQWFSNVPDGDPFGAQAPLFYGPLQQGKDGWNAAFFCGSNAVLRREALLSGGVRRYAEELRERIGRAIVTSGRVLNRTERTMSPEERARMGPAFSILRRALQDARKALRDGDPLQEITWSFQRAAQQASRVVVQADLQAIRAELAEIPGIGDDLPIEAQLSDHLGDDDDPILRELVQRDTSPLAAIEAVRGLLLAVDLDRDDEAQPVMPMATISVTEDMATSMRMHANGWKSVYHHEILATGLAPDDLLSVLKQRLRWAQGTIQVFLRENPLFVRGLSLAQKLMYFATMWSYFSGFFAVIYLLAPVLFLLFGWMPVTAFSYEFFWRIGPYLLVNQLLFWVVGRGLPKWRGQQYSLALFPVWIQAVTSAVGNVVFGRKLGFVVTPKTRQGGASLRLIAPQIVMASLLVIGCIAGLARLATGNHASATAIVLNIGWSIYDLAALSVLALAVRYRPVEDVSGPVAAETGVVERGRAGAGMG
jgi:cellulose synthase (UDP-forming)